MNVRNWSFFSNKEAQRKVKEHMLDTICLWGAIGLLWYAFVSMVGEHFPDFLKKTILVSKSELISTSFVSSANFETIGMDWRVIGLFLFVLWLGYDWPKLYLKKIGTVCRFAGFAIPVVYFMSDLGNILNGFYKLLELYLPHVNSYYKTRFFLQAASIEGNPIAAFSVLCMLLWCMVWMLAYGWNNRVLLALFPFLALGLELAVGLSPQGNGILIWFFAAILLSIIGGTSIIKKIIVLACVGISVFLSIFIFQTDIERLASKDSKQALLRWQHNLNLEDFNPFRFLQIDLHYNWESLNNDAPQYTGKVVLEIESSNAPISVIYLRGFYGTSYEDGNWTYDASAFEAACDRAGKNPEDVAAEIFQMPFDALQTHYGDSRDKHNTFRILYTGTTGDVAYVPYLSNHSSLDEEYTLLGDYLLKKDIWDNSVKGENLTVPAEASHWYSILGYGYGKLVTDETDWVDELANAYLDIPDTAEFVPEAVEEIKAYIQDNIYFYSELSKGNNADKNVKRILYANAVDAYLERQMSYSLKLDNLPMGRDPIEYALNYSHEGYCMHFASAATLLLRELGVPARYVSGYAVEPTEFEYETDTEVYVAEIGDYMAHAWVEIYLDDIGWIPVEVTPGSSLNSLPTDEEIQRWESLSNAHRQELIDQENESESEESEAPSENMEEETEETQTEDTEENREESESEEEDEKNKGGNGGKIPFEILLQGLSVIGILGLIAGVAFFIGRGAKQWISHYETALQREMKKNMTRKAVKRMNRRMYIMLRISNWPNGFMKKWSDMEYRNVLVKSFSEVSEEEWDKYMEIVKKNHYSHETISVEEMQYVYECYKKTEWFNKRLTNGWHNKK